MDEIILKKREDVIEKLRNLKDELYSLEKKYSSREIDSILFDSKTEYIYTVGMPSYFAKTIALPKEILYKIDFSNISFNDVDVRDIDFTNLNNVELDVQKIFSKSLENTILNGVTLVGDYDDVELLNTDFTNAKGNLEVNPQLVRNKSLKGCTMNGVMFTDGFRNVVIENTNFDGSRVISMKKVKRK